MSQAARDILPLRNLLQELSTITKFIAGNTIAHSTILEDNKGCVDLAVAHKLHPQTKHIALKYHHFCCHVASGAIRVQWIDTKHQLANIFTKPLSFPIFEYLCSLLLDW